MPFCPHLGVSLRRGSLAKERNTFTFLSNLVRTALACSTLSLPHLKSLRHTRKKTQRRGEKQVGSLGLEYFMAESLGLVLNSAGQGLRPTEGALASLLLEGTSFFSSVLSPQLLNRPWRAPHPTPPPAPENPGRELGPASQPTMFHQPQPISNISLSLLISFLQFPRKSAPLTHTHSHNPNPPPRACSKMSVCNSRDPVEGNLPVSSWADLSLPSLHPTIWCLGG